MLAQLGQEQQLRERLSRSIASNRPDFLGMPRASSSPISVADRSVMAQRRGDQPVGQRPVAAIGAAP